MSMAYATGPENGAKLIELARELIERTRARRIPWKPSSHPGRYVFGGSEGSVSIEGPSDPESASYILRSTFGDAYILRILDQSGTEIDRIGTGINMYTAHGPMPPDAEAVLRELYQAVSGTDPRSSRVIDRLLDEVRRR